MDKLSTVVTVGGFILIIVSTLAFIYAYYTMNLSKAQIANLRGDRDDQALRIKRLEDELDESKRLRAADIKEKADLRARVTTLQGLVTHDTKINDLILTLNKHDRKVEEKYAEYMASNREILKRIDRLLAIQERRDAG